MSPQVACRAEPYFSPAPSLCWDTHGWENTTPTDWSAGKKSLCNSSCLWLAWLFGGCCPSIMIWKVFSKDQALSFLTFLLPPVPHQPYYCAIDLLPGSQSTVHTFPPGKREHGEVHHWLPSCWRCLTSFFCVLASIFVSKNDHSHHPCIDYRAFSMVSISCLSSNMPSSHFMGPPSLPSWTCGLHTTCLGRDKGASGRLHLTFPWATMVTWSCPLISSMPWKCSKVLLATLDLIQPLKHNHQYAPLWMLSGLFTSFFQHPVYSVPTHIHPLCHALLTITTAYLTDIGLLHLLPARSESLALT